MFARLTRVLIPIFMGVSVIHVVLVFRRRESGSSSVLLRPRAAFVHETHRLRPGDVAGLDPVDAESCAFDHAPDRAVEVTAAAATPPDRRQPILPPAHALVGRETMLYEQELAAWPQHAPQFRQCHGGLWNRTQGPGRHRR